MTPHMLNTIPHAAILGPQNKRDGIFYYIKLIRANTRTNESLSEGQVMCAILSADDVRPGIR